MLRTLRFCLVNNIFIQNFFQFFGVYFYHYIYVIYDWITIIIMGQVSMNITL